MKRFCWALGFLLLFFSTTSSADVVDAPHNGSQNILCRDCHSYSLWWAGSPSTGAGGDHGAVSDAVCQTCHGANGSVVQKSAHSSAVMGTTIPGQWEWTTNCIECHNPHLQAQLTWLTIDPLLADELYLVLGDIGPAEDFSTVDNGDGTFSTSFSYINAQGAPPWESAATWSTKTGTERGLILVLPTTTADNTYEVVEAVETAPGADNGTMTVLGSIDSSTAGSGFGLIYGQLIKKEINQRSVQFFGPSSGYVDTLSNDGVCQSCHTATKFWRVDGQNSDPATGLLHYHDITCTVCHLTSTGFTPSGGPHDFLGESASCITCHQSGDILAVHKNNCQNCHTTPPELADPLDKPLAEQIVSGDCQGCHGAVVHVSATTHNQRQSTLLCATCHAIGSQDAIDTLHAECSTCHGYSGDVLNASVVAAVIEAGKGTSGDKVECTDCHTAFPGSIHHATVQAANNNCMHCHTAVDHSLMVHDSASPQCIGCHTETAGTASGIVVDPASSKVHFSCSSCHDFDTDLRGVLKDYTNNKGVDGSGILPDGNTIGGTDGGGLCSDCHTGDAQAFHHVKPQVAVGECEACHTDPRPGRGNYQPGDNGGSSQYPTQLACLTCHVRFVGDTVTIIKYTRTQYNDLSTPWTTSVQHSIPGVSRGQINTFGICFSCHGEGSATPVKVFHARPDQHDSGNYWALGSKDWRRHDDPGPAQAFYAAGRSSSGIGSFNLFSDSYNAAHANGLDPMDLPASDLKVAFRDELMDHSSPRVSWHPYMSYWGPPDLMNIPSASLNLWTSGDVVVLPAIESQSAVSGVADPVQVQHAVYDGSDLIVIASNTDGCESLTASYGGSDLPMSGNVYCTAVFAGANYPDDGGSIAVTTSNVNGIHVTGYPISDQPGAVAVNDFYSAFSSISTGLDILTNDIGSGLTLISIGAASHGTAQISGNTVLYTANAGYEGSDTLLYTIEDGNGTTSQGMASISVAINQEPIVIDDAYTVVAGSGQIVLDVLGNDSDPEEENLTISSMTQPLAGSAIFSSSDITYTPPASGFDGDDVFTYQVTDGMGNTVSGQVTVTVATPRDWVTVLDTWQPTPLFTQTWQPSMRDVNGYFTVPNTPSVSVSPGLDRLLVVSVTAYLPSVNNSSQDLFQVSYGDRILTEAFAQTSVTSYYSSYLGYLYESDIAGATGSELTVKISTGYHSVSAFVASYANVNQTTAMTASSGNDFFTSSPFPVIDPAAAPLSVHAGQYAVYNMHTASCVTRVSDSEGYTGHIDYIDINQSANLGLAAKRIATDGTTNPLVNNDTCGAHGTSSFMVLNNTSGGSVVVDTDFDGVAEPVDLCPNTTQGQAVNSDGCALSQLDSDEDSITDDLDLCPNTPAGEGVDADGCSVSQLTDSDQDGVSDADDQCPDTPLSEPVDGNGCSLISQVDSDQDGVYDQDDLCPGTPAAEPVNGSGCSYIESYQLPDTGQTSSYTATFGEDHDYAINPPSYSDANGTVVDHNTGLIWQQQDDGDSSRNWNSANAYCAALSLGGYGAGWRLPTKKELATVVDFEKITPYPYEPAIDPIFITTSAAKYWSVTPYVNTEPGYARAFTVDFSNGFISHQYYVSTALVRCVHDPAAPAQTGSLADNGDGTISDSLTKLTWQQSDDGVTRDWEQAIGYCEGLSLGGSDAWRLPNFKELISITDDSRYNPAIDPLFLNTQSATGLVGYWSSTSYDQYAPSDYAMAGAFFYGGSTIKIKATEPSYVRCVRSGP